MNYCPVMKMWVLTRQSLAGVSVADVMSARPHTAPGWISVEEFIQRYLLGDRHSSYPVENSDGVITGLITLNRCATSRLISAPPP